VHQELLPVDFKLEWQMLTRRWFKNCCQE